MAVAGARRTPARHKTGGVPPKPPATNILFVTLGVLGLRIVVPEALQRPFGRLLRQRQYGSSQTLRHPCGQLLWQRQSCDVAASQFVCSCGADKLNHRSRL